ncbi:unnamed protein product [Owenia fusiformis]|uniref:Cyclase n=1 Tax=Owenia fusiformis TaxID=6347 RepID=A0A8S4Q966_OWEFU|nr:unnamed protein product [Owenia fusiformis]
MAIVDNNVIYRTAVLISSVMVVAQGRYIDLTYNINSDVMRWPSHTKFTLKVDIRGPFASVNFLASNSFETSEHVATHIDAPFHFNQHGIKIHEMPFDNFYGPAVVIDIKEKASKVPDATLDINDVTSWEEKYNTEIPKGAIVIMNSGWGKYWGNSSAFLGGTTTNSLHYPGFSGEAVTWLVDNRDIKGIIVDTVSCDPGNSAIGEAHLAILQASSKWCVEMAANLDEVPAKGANVFAMPIKIENGTGAPIRLYAEVGAGWGVNSGRTLIWAESCVIALIMFMFLYL